MSGTGDPTTDRLVELVRDVLTREGASERVRARALGAETRFVEDLQLDSMSMMGLAIEVERHFDIELEEAEEESLETLGDLADLLRRRCGN